MLVSSGSKLAEGVSEKVSDKKEEKNVSISYENTEIESASELD